MSSFTTIGRGHGAPCFPATIETWQQARQDPQLSQLCQQIETCTNVDEQKRLKDRLPVWTPRCGEFRNNHRSQQDAICHLNRQMFDIDEKGHTDEILAMMKPKSVSNGSNPETSPSTGSGQAGATETLKPSETEPMFIGDFEILQVEESVRRGTHVLVIPPAGMSLNDAQYAFSQLIHLPVDPAVKNVAGCIYMVPEDHVRYQSSRFFECEEVEKVESVEKVDVCVEEEVSINHQPSTINQTDGYPTDYDGIPYSYIVEALAEQLGGVPVHGSRNNFIFSMACHLRYICNDDVRWIISILPTYGEERSRVERTAQSAINRAQSRQMPALVQRALSVARSRVQVSEGLNGSNGSNGEDSINHKPYTINPPAMPKKLPKLIAHLVSKVDPMYRPAVAQAVFPALGAHLHGVRVRYIDNSEADLGGFMSVLLAKQSIGKGSVNMPIEAIMEDIRQRDLYNRDLEKQWKQQCKSSKANEKKPTRPEGLCIQYLMSNMTNAALVQRLVDAQTAGDRFLYVKVDELEQLDQIKATGGATASEIIRLCFTQSLYGQERVGHDSVTGTPPLRFNFNASSTPATGQAYFAKGLTNGTLSRLTFATIIKPDGYRGIPRFGDYDEQFHRTLAPFITNLNAATGLIECRQAERMAQRLAEQNELLSELSDDEEFETLSYRANRIVYDKAMLLYIADGYQWSKSIADFCEWSEQYDLWCKMHFFGQQMRDTVQQQLTVSLPGVQNMLELLPDRFSREDLIALRRAQGKDANASHALAVWVNRGYIVQDKATLEYIKTDAYKAKHSPFNT